MKIVTAAEMREIDRVTSERFGVPSLTLMENAGSAVADFVIAAYPEVGRIGVVCGKGNNGGDGFVVARKLREAGRDVSVLLLCEPSELKGDAAEMFKRLGLPCVLARDADDLNNIDAQRVIQADLVVDAILGTGFRPPVKGFYASVIEAINAAPRPVIAVDIPSGADADSLGEVNGLVAKADAVVTFTAPRPAHVFASLTTGPSLCAAIGSPDEAIISALRMLCQRPGISQNYSRRVRRTQTRGTSGTCSWLADRSEKLVRPRWPVSPFCGRVPVCRL